MSRSSELLTNAAFTTKAFPLLQPVYVGIDAALSCLVVPPPLWQNVRGSAECEGQAPLPSAQVPLLELSALPEERVVDEVILGICAARDHYNKPEKGYMERLEAYIVQLTARAAPAMPFETVEAVSHSVQRLFQLFEVVVTQASEHRLQQVLSGLNLHGWSTFDEA
ncbi:hypothetical protein Rt10032_c05g2189 [Rhodotorula toruloides]|uniref:Uncharacterized protein n=1 Tax=Rhodotorula toruloides TaxID=5286 RepID=A0A511KCZ1_RHOTO|nr:hypothetical protein Rt10032_c05g2189 [Rhodotorula toruloides]